MADTPIEKLTIELNAESENANQAIDNLISKIDNLAKSLTSIKGKSATGAIDDVKKQSEKAVLTLSQITDKYKDLGKGFTLKGSADYLQKQVDGLYNSLAKATLKKQELETTEKTGGKMYEYAVRDTIKFQNQIEGLEKQLKKISETKVSPQVEESIQREGEKKGNYTGNTGAVRKPTNVSPEALGYNQEAIEFIKNYSKNAESSVEGLVEKLSKLVVPEVKEENLKKLGSAILKTEQKLDSLRAKLENGLTMGTITESADDKNYVRLQEQIALTEKQLEAFLEKKAEVESTNGTGLDGFRGKIGKIGMAISKATSGFAKFAIGAKNIISKIASLGKSMLGLNKNTKGFSGGLKKMLAYGFGIRSVYVLFNKLRSAIKEGIKNLVQFSSETNASVSLLNNSFTQLKNASSAMAAPLLNALAPALNTIIQWCVKATNAVNQLISALTGKSTWIKAKTLTDDYASSLDKANGSANKLKTTTLGIDELNINSKDDSSVGGTSATDMFEYEDISSKWANIAEWLKSMWESADFTELGAILGTKLKNALDSIDWEDVKESAKRIGASIGTFITGFFETEGLGYSIGKTLAETINTGVIGANKFLDSTHFDSIGKFLADGLSGLVHTIDTGEIGKSLGEIIKSILDTAIGFLEGTDWKDIGATVYKKIMDFVLSIDWSGISAKLFEGIGAALGALASFIWGFVESGWNNVISWWYDIAYEDGEFTMEGLLNGIVEALKDIGAWIKENIFQPFIDGFKNAFGIHSPSTVMKEQGGFIISGLLKGLTDNIPSVWSWAQKIPNEFKSFFKNLPSDFKDIGKNVIAGLWDGMKSIWNSVTSWLSNAAQNVSKTFKKVLDIHSPSRVMAEVGGYTIEGFKEGMENLYEPTIESLKGFSYDVQVAPLEAPKLNCNYGYSVVQSSASSNYGEEIAGSVKRAIKEVVSEMLEPYLSDIAESNRTVADKDFSVAIGDREIYKANLRGAKASGRLLVT